MVVSEETKSDASGVLIDDAAFARIKELAGSGTVVHLDDVLSLLGIELTSEVLSELSQRLADVGLTLDSDVEDDLDDETEDDAKRANGSASHEASAVAAAPSAAVSLASEQASASSDGRTSKTAPKTRSRGSIRNTAASSTGSGDSVRMYLAEIGKVALLTGPQEVELAKRIEAGAEAGQALADLAASGELLTMDRVERRALERTRRDGDRAKDALTEANLRLVVSIAKRYVGRGMQMMDLIQEGNLGLMRAVEKFDYTKGFKFSTYATWWIRQAITRSIADQARTIRIPVHMVESINKMHRYQRQLTQELEREPTVEELAEKVEMTPERVREILRISQDPLSLDSPVGEEADSSLADFIEDSRAEAPADIAAKQSLHQAINEAISELNEREQAVVRLRFGLADGHIHTLEEVGKQFGVTRERIRQIESKTLAKLRNPQRSKKLKDYLDGE